MVDPERNATDIDTVFVLQFSLSVYSHVTHKFTSWLGMPMFTYFFFADVKYFQNFNTKYTWKTFFKRYSHQVGMNMWMIYRVFFVCNLSYNVISIMNIISTFSQMLMYKSSNHHSKSQWLLTAMKRKIYNTITHIQTM